MTLPPIEIFEFFYVLRKNNWEGVWQLDQFPFREDSVEMANQSIDFLKAIEKALDELDIKALQEAMKADKSIVLVAQKNSEVDDPKKTDVFMYGCESSILQLLKLPDGTVKVLVEGLNRASINVFFENEDFLQADVDQIIETIDSSDKQLRAMSKSTTDEFDKYVNLMVAKQRSRR